MIGEFDLIHRYLAPLAAQAPEALGLEDDAAIVTPPPGRDLVLAADALIEGVHFLPDDPAGLVARKLLRVNLSDLAAMGAEPLGYLVTAAWPADKEEDWIAAFAAGLGEDQDSFAIKLLGGDTTRTSGPLALSLTVLGTVPAGRAMRRATAQPGDLLFVSGTLGDAALGLRAVRGDLPGLPAAARDFLIDRYRLPQPRLALGGALLESGLATAAIDVSDGLVADVGHVAQASGLAARIEAAAVPLSPAAQAVLDDAPALRAAVLTGGDDYELAFAVPREREDEIAAMAGRVDLPLTRVGRFAAGDGVMVVDEDGNSIALEAAGWTHF
jgi:thiamine-monophosphate kinase